MDVSIWRIAGLVIFEDFGSTLPLLRRVRGKTQLDRTELIGAVRDFQGIGSLPGSLSMDTASPFYKPIGHFASRDHGTMSQYHAANVLQDHSDNRNRRYSGYVNSQLGSEHMTVAQGHHMGIPHVGSNMSQASLHHPYAAQEQPVAYQTYPMPIHVGMPEHNPYPVPMAFQTAMPGLQPISYGAQALPYTPGRIASYTDRSSEVPGLENRRGSYSTTDSAPATPFFGSASERGHHSRVAVVRSAFNTPSPEQLLMPGLGPKVPQVVEDDVIELLKATPEIPKAVPAVFTPATHIKTLDQCLENRISGNRNVYIRGLHPTTDDDLLLKYAERFGEVEQSKAIIDTSTGACKGFGFAKFKDVMDSIKCIKGFFHLGYEVGFARESFNARLKAEGDESSTNLYLSNLPKNLNEAELNAIFHGYRVLSSKILRDNMGNSRGVGFARFESREECEDVIQKYHGIAVGASGMQMQVRYADTPAQKELKRITAERRQFRTNEYNIGAYGTADVGVAPSIYNPYGRRSGIGSELAYAGQMPSMVSLALSAAKGHAVTPSHTYKQSNSVGARVSSDDGSADEGVSVTIVETPSAKNGSTQSSPTVKREKS
ncbi:hypothetical protein P8C59_000766 [Phyllachora maydis]|uniref:RRM domain-containing protein n=1 Tax=Phyllachora maydis TaxID=1825666 RepID=A0AAD9M841_9PEZI|nr:hypothetical protein P8C59_000766 [Phyllachora maydis]